MSIFAIGDIHGYSDLLDDLLDQLPISDDDLLVFLGDYIDRGLDSRGVVERIMRLKRERGDRCVCLLGNHEDMMLDHWRRTRGPWRMNQEPIPGLSAALDYGRGFWVAVGGDATLSSYAGEIPEDHIAFFAGLPLVHEEDDFIFVHAGVRLRGDNPRAEMLWGATGFFSDLDVLSGRILGGATRAMNKRAVVGHTVFDHPLVGPDFIAIDTGCGYDGPLTAVQLPEVRFFQASPSKLRAIVSLLRSAS